MTLGIDIVASRMEGIDPAKESSRCHDMLRCGSGKELRDKHS